MSADLLKRAAAKVREAAAPTSALEEWAEYYGNDAACPEADRPWIALMSPVLAEPLARTLEQHADEHSTYDCDWAECPTVELARSIVGEVTVHA